MDSPAITSTDHRLHPFSRWDTNWNVSWKYLGTVQHIPLHYEQTSETVLNSMRVFDPAPPGTLAEEYFRMVSYKESDSR